MGNGRLVICTVVCNFSRSNRDICGNKCKCLTSSANLDRGNTQGVIGRLITHKLLGRLGAGMNNVLIGRCITIQGPAPRAIPRSNTSPCGGYAPAGGMPLRGICPGPCGGYVRAPAGDMSEGCVKGPVKGPVCPHRRHKASAVSKLSATQRSILRHFQRRLRLSALRHQCRPRGLRRLLSGVTSVCYYPNTVRVVKRCPRAARSVHGQLSGLADRRVRCILSTLLGDAGPIRGVQNCVQTILLGTPAAVRRCCRTGNGDVTTNKKNEH